MYKIKLTDEVKWVLSAVTKNNEDSRYNLNTIKATTIDGDAVLICCDSHRIHMVANNQDVLAGLYAFTIVKKEVILEEVPDRYPDPSNLLTKSNYETTDYIWDNTLDTDFTGEEKKVRLARVFSKALIKFFRMYPGYINIKYLESLTGVWKVHIKDNKEDPVKFYTDDRMAVIMPFYNTGKISRR